MRSATSGPRWSTRCARRRRCWPPRWSWPRPPRSATTGLTLAWPESSAFLKRKAEDPANREAIVKAIRSVTGSSLRLAYELRAGDAEAVVTAPKLSEDDLVKRFMDEFDAEELPPEPEEQT